MVSAQQNPAKVPQISSYADAQAVLARAPRRTGRIGHNTAIGQYDDGSIFIILYSTPILVFRSDDTVAINSGGHHTVTTKARINSILPGTIRVYAKRRQWKVRTPSGDEDFFDGIRFDLTRPTTARTSRPHAMNPRGPRKFDSDLDEWVYHLTLDGADEEVSIGGEWWGKLANVEGERMHALVHEDSQGLVSVSYYRSEAALDRAWDTLVEDLTAEEEEEEEE